MKPYPLSALEEPCTVFDDLTPSQALTVLAETAEAFAQTKEGKTAGDDAGPGMIRVLEPEPDENAGYAVELKAGLVLPDFHHNMAVRDRISGLMNRAYTKIKGRSPSRVDDILLVRPLSGGAAWLLAYSGHNMTPDESADALKAPGTRLLIADQIDRKQAQDLFLRLRVRATYTCIAADPLIPCYLFYIRRDVWHGSDFAGLSGAGDPNLRLLSEYLHHDRSVFLPDEIRIRADALDAFSRLRLACRDLFGAARTENEHGFLTAVCPRPPTPPDADHPGKRNYRIIDLFGLDFSEQFELEAPIARQAGFDVIDFSHSPSYVDGLGRMPEPEKGWTKRRLRLRETRFSAGSIGRPIARKALLERHQERLERELSALKFELYALNTTPLPHTRLLRFTQDQLSGLAEVLRAVPPDELLKGSILYGSEADSNHPDGRHFLLAPAGSLTETLAIGNTPEERPARFWVDPYWAADYYGKNRSAVFVPEGTALFPPIHHHPADEMDAGLQNILKRWFPDREIPDFDEPLYIFDGTASPPGKIEISVLNRADMAPLQERIGWLNDNLLLAEHRDNRERLQRMAHRLRQEELAGQIDVRALDAVESFEETARATGREIAERLGEMADAVSDEITRIIQKTEEAVGEIRSLDEALDRLIKETDQDTHMLTREMEGLEVRVDETLKNAALTRERMDVQLNEEIERLRETRQALTEKFQEALRHLGRRNS